MKLYCHTCHSVMLMGYHTTRMHWECVNCDQVARCEACQTELDACTSRNYSYAWCRGEDGYGLLHAVPHTRRTVRLAASA